MKSAAVEITGGDGTPVASFKKANLAPGEMEKIMIERSKLTKFRNITVSIKE